MLDNMVVPLADGDVDISMLKAAVELIDGRFDTEVALFITCILFVLLSARTCNSLIIGPVIKLPSKLYPLNYHICVIGLSGKRGGSLLHLI